MKELRPQISVVYNSVGSSSAKHPVQFFFMLQSDFGRAGSERGKFDYSVIREKGTLTPQWIFSSTWNRPWSACRREVLKLTSAVKLRHVSSRRKIFQKWSFDFIDFCWCRHDILMLSAFLLYHHLKAAPSPVAFFLRQLHSITNLSNVWKRFPNLPCLDLGSIVQPGSH